MPNSTDNRLAKVRALLAKAENPAATEAEAAAYTAKATELMAKYGIEQALLGDRDPGSAKPANRVFTVENPWGGERASLLYFLAKALRCRPIMLDKDGSKSRVHVFGFDSDLERVEMLYTSLLLQMANGLARVSVPAYDSPKAYRRSWLFGFREEVVRRVEAAEARAVADSRAEHPESSAERGTALVLADRQQLVDQAFSQEHPHIRTTSSRYSGYGSGAGREAGARANIGQTGIGSRRAIGGAR